MKICKVCKAEFDNNPFIYCDDCMDLNTAIQKWNDKKGKKQYLWIRLDDINKIIKPKNRV